MAKTPGEGESHHPSFTVKGGLEVDECSHKMVECFWYRDSTMTVSTPLFLYPFNHVIETESDIMLRLMTQRDNERIHVYHKTEHSLR